MLLSEVAVASGTTTDLLRGDCLAKRIASYENSAESNEAIYAEFTKRTNRIAFLKEHRDWVEENAWGFGDRAFHYLWLLIVQHVCSVFPEPRLALEIGVYKGQVLSLMALCAEILGVSVDLFAVSPFSGNRPRSNAVHLLRKLVEPGYRRIVTSGNAYEQNDYLAACDTVFKRFGLNFADVTVWRGKSSDAVIYDKVRRQEFAVIYIDGDHSFGGVRNDIVHYCPLIKAGGLLVMDDASCYVPGRGYFKGHLQVSRAAVLIPPLGFKNVLNIGHNRVYMRID